MSQNEKNLQSSAIKFIVSDDENPKVELKAGMKFSVQTVELVDTNLKAANKVAARLCGGTSTCVALIGIED